MEYTNLVISGAGVKNFATIGALESIGVDRIKNFKRYLGISSGSILATLVCLGCTTDDIKKLFGMVDMKKYKVNYASLYTYYKLFRNNGVHSSDDFREDVIHKILEIACGNGNITFREIKKRYDKILVIPAACINKREMYYYQASSNPNMQVKEAIQQSCCIPGIFTPVYYKGDTIVDGGVIDNYPLYFFNNEIKTPNSKEVVIFNVGEKINEKTLGIMITDPNTSKKSDVAYLGNDPTKTLIELIKALFNTILTTNERKSIKENFWENTITINVQDVEAVYEIPKEKLYEIYEQGKKSASDFFLLK